MKKAVKDCESKVLEEFEQAGGAKEQFESAKRKGAEGKGADSMRSLLGRKRHLAFS